MAYTQVYRCFSVFQIGLNFTMSYCFLKEIFRKKVILLRLLTVVSYVSQIDYIAPRNTLILVLLFLGDISLQIRINFHKTLQGSVNCCKLDVSFKNQRRFPNALDLKTNVTILYLGYDEELLFHCKTFISARSFSDQLMFIALVKFHSFISHVVDFRILYVIFNLRKIADGLTMRWCNHPDICK